MFLFFLIFFYWRPINNLIKAYCALFCLLLIRQTVNLIHEMGKKKQNDSQQSSKTDTVSTSSNIFSKLFNKSQNRLPQWPPPLYFLMTTPFEENLLHFLTQRIALRTLMMVTTLMHGQMLHCIRFHHCRSSSC